MKKCTLRTAIRVSMACIILLQTKAIDSMPVKLENPVLRLLDGVTYALDGPCIKDMLYIRREIRKEQFGVKNPATGKLEGHYVYENNKYTVHELAKIEYALETYFAQKKSELAECNATPQAYAQLDQERTNQQLLMEQLLYEAKENFKRINEPYLASVSGTKSMMVLLVEESCKKHECENSFLLNWAHVPEGGEFASFDKNIMSFQALDRFCSDLTNFLDDVIRSCPKGCKQAGLNLPN